MSAKVRPTPSTPGAALWRRYPWLPSYGACLFFAIMAVCIKLLTKSMPTGSIMFFRSVIPLGLFIPSLLWRQASARRRAAAPGLLRSAHRYRWSLLGRGGCGALSLLCYLLAMREIPASEVALTTSTAPLFASLSAWLFLGEPLGRKTGWAFLFSFMGVVLVVDGGVQGAMAGYVAGIASAAMGGMAYSFIRQAKELPPELIALAFTATATLGSLPWVLSEQVQLSAEGWALLLLMGLAGGFGQWLMTMGYQHNSVAVASTLGLAQVACTAILASLYLAESFSPRQMVGVVLVLAGTWSLTSAPGIAQPRS